MWRGLLKTTILSKTIRQHLKEDLKRYKMKNHYLKNYHPICLFSYIDKLFIKVTVTRLTEHLDDQQPIKQTSFSKNYNIMDYIFTQTQVKTSERIQVASLHYFHWFWGLWQHRVSVLCNGISTSVGHLMLERVRLVLSFVCFRVFIICFIIFDQILIKKIGFS